MTSPRETVRLTQVQDYRFDVAFGGDIPAMHCDEPPPLGAGAGPSPVQLLCAAVGNCLSASLLFAVRKYKQDPGTIACEVQAEVGRNAENRLRVLGMAVTLNIGVPGDTVEHLDRALASFEDFCTVTQSVRTGIPVSVAVFDAHGAQLK
ncbi:MAG: OsmC family protein [Proteobacteria bacterium]|nr:OsmC family protein [Pseudomonadota bacterium]